MAVESATETKPKRMIEQEISSRLRTKDLRVRSIKAEILKGITREIHRGEIVSIIGPAGAGKTTFLRALNRMNDLESDLATSGEVLLDGRSVYAPDVDVALLRLTVGMVFSVPGKNGQPLNGIVQEVRKDVVLINFNHPLAGKTVTFDIEILDVK